MTGKRERNSFKTPLVLEVMSSGKKFKLHYPFTYLWQRENIDIHVGAGFITDLASIPVMVLLAVAASCLIASHYVVAVAWLFWVGFAIVVLAVLIQKLGRQNKAAVIHDAIYQDVVPGFRFTRAEADQVFLDGMKDAGVGKFKRYVMYYAVRLGGFASWKRRSFKKVPKELDELYGI